MFFWRRRHQVREEELSAYLDGELEAARRDRVEAHVEECAACREILGELRSVRQALRDLPRATVPRSFALREADIHPEVAPRAVGALGRTVPMLSGVATAAVVVFGVLVGIDLTGGIQGGADDGAAPAAIRYAPEDAEAGAAMADEDGLAVSGDNKRLTEEDAPEENGLVAPMPAEDVEAVSGAEGTPAADGTPQPGGLDGTDERPATAPEPEAECDAGVPCDDGEFMFSSNGLSPTATPGGAEIAARSYDPDLRRELVAEDEGPSRMRVAEAAAAAVALVAGGSLALVWWRRRA